MIVSVESSPEKRVGASLLSRFVSAVVVGLFSLLALFAPRAQAALGYEPDASKPFIPLPGEQPQQVAIDQSNQRIYVAIMLHSISDEEGGYVVQLESTGIQTAASPFTPAPDLPLSGVAVNPITHGIYIAEFEADTPLGVVGDSRIFQASSSGTSGTQFATGNPINVLPKIATDSSGNLYYPNSAAHAIQVFNSAGVLQSTISCGSCPGGLFTPVGVAHDSQGNLYVVDTEHDRVVKLTHSGGPYVFDSVIQSGQSVSAVAVDTTNDSVLVGDYPEGGSYHVVAYDSSGVQFDDFGTGLFAGAFFSNTAGGQIAVNLSNHKLYISDPSGNALRVFSRVTINPPTAITNAASSIGQLAATLKGAVNANFHATTDCHFEYTDDADFQANVYANAIDKPCPSLPAGSESTEVTAALSSLSPATTYHYRVMATNNAGSTIGGNQEFTTLPLAAPTVTTGAASGVKQMLATLTGKVNPQGGTVSDCHFEYGTSQSYGTSIPCSTVVGMVTTEVTQNRQITGLSPSTTYHYRLSVTNNAGTTKGDDAQFTTVTPPPVEDPPVVTPAPLPPQATTTPVVVTHPKKLVCKKGFRKARVRGKLRCVKKKKHRRR